MGWLAVAPRMFLGVGLALLGVLDIGSNEVHVDQQAAANGESEFSVTLPVFRWLLTNWLCTCQWCQVSRRPLPISRTVPSIVLAILAMLAVEYVGPTPCQAIRALIQLNRACSWSSCACTSAGTDARMTTRPSQVGPARCRVATLLTALAQRRNRRRRHLSRSPRRTRRRRT
jgi:hypothetical protein